MELEDIKKQLDKKFEEPLKQFYKRRIVIWDDADKEFLEEIDKLELDNAKVLKLTGNNNFKVKKILLEDCPTDNFLLYNPISYNNVEDDWFLDIKLYSEKFRADLVAIWIEEMGLNYSLQLYNEFKKYKKFLRAKPRRENLAEIITKSNSPEKVIGVSVMAAITKSNAAKPNDIIISILREGLKNDDNSLYQDIVNYEVEDLFWSMVCSITGYFKDNRDLEELAIHIVLTASYKMLPEEVFGGITDYMSIRDRHIGLCSDIVYEMLQDDYYIETAKVVEDKVNMKDRLMKLKNTDLVNTEIFPIINKIILTNIMKDIENEIIDMDTVCAIIEKRRTCKWFNDYKEYYEGIFTLMNMERFRKDNASGFHTVGAKNVWDEYTNEYYKMDNLYREFYVSYENSKKSEDYDGDLQELFRGVCDRVERLYTNCFLEDLSYNWIEQAKNELSKYGYIEGVERQEDFYENHVRNSNSRVYVIISDAMRFDVAASLKEEISCDMRGQTSLSSMQAIFPTDTRFGMAALLPHKKLSIEETDNNVKVLVDGEFSDSNYREKILKKENAKSVVLKAKQLDEMTRTEKTEVVKGTDVVYIYHDTIDEAGHSTWQNVFDACGNAIKEIKKLVKIIVNDFCGTNIIITSDHGFLYTHSLLEEKDKLEKGDYRVIELGRRFVILSKDKASQYLIPIKFIGDDKGFFGYATRGNIRIKTSGSLNFVHGGVSLQEMCVPLIKYKHLRNDSKEYQKNKDKYDTKPVEIMLLSASRKISNLIFGLGFYQKEAVNENRKLAYYRIYFEDSKGDKVSDVQKVIADKKDEEVKDREFRCTFNLKSRAYDNRETYKLVIENEENKERILEQEFQIDIAFVDDFGF